MVTNAMNLLIKNNWLQKAANNSNYKQLHKALNGNSKISTLDKKESNQKPDDLMKQKINNIKYQLRVSKDSEDEIQNGMSILQEKEIGLEKIKAAGEKLEELSTQYKSPDLGEKDRMEIKKQAEELLNGLENLMNKTKAGENIIGDKIIQLKDSTGKESIISSAAINITLDFDKLDDSKLNKTEEKNLFNGKHFENKVSVATLLETPSIIQERILNPVQNSIEKLNDAKSVVYNKFINEYSSATNSIDELFKLGSLSKNMKDMEILSQKILLNSVSALYFQSSNINRDNVSALLK